MSVVVGCSTRLGKNAYDGAIHEEVPAGTTTTSSQQLSVIPCVPRTGIARRWTELMVVPIQVLVVIPDTTW